MDWISCVRRLWRVVCRVSKVVNVFRAGAWLLDQFDDPSDFGA